MVYFGIFYYSFSLLITALLFDFRPWMLILQGSTKPPPLFQVPFELAFASDDITPSTSNTKPSFSRGESFLARPSGRWTILLPFCFDSLQLHFCCGDCSHQVRMLFAHELNNHVCRNDVLLFLFLGWLAWKSWSI